MNVNLVPSEACIRSIHMNFTESESHVGALDPGTQEGTVNLRTGVVELFEDITDERGLRDRISLSLPDVRIFVDRIGQRVYTCNGDYLARLPKQPWFPQDVDVEYFLSQKAMINAIVASAKTAFPAAHGCCIIA